MSDYFLCVVNDFTSLDQRYLDKLTRSLQNSMKVFKEVRADADVDADVDADADAVQMQMQMHPAAACMRVYW